MAPFQCLPESITTKKTWPYFERYHGKKDEENRRTGHGEYYWSNAESLESYEGPFFRDTMHGCGTYRWRWLGEDGDHISYEGYFFTNKMHGYGTMSYPDGRTFVGLYYKDLRWGPGIMRHVDRKADVGFWRGNQLIRLTWRPPTISLIPDIAGCLIGPHFLEQFRIILFNRKKTVSDTNSVLDLLKNQGVLPLEAAEQRINVYSKYCTDMESILCHKSEFYKSYYGDTINTLEESTPEISTSEKLSRKASRIASRSFTHEERVKEYHYAWNNDPVILHMMKHAFQHDSQRPTNLLDLALLLGGPRQRLPTPGIHELDCRTTLMACYLGDKSTMLTMIQEDNVHPNISDIQGNTALMYATCGNQTDIIHYLVDAGAPVDTLNDACFTPLGVALLIYNLTKYDVPLFEYANVLMTPSSFPLEYPGSVVTDWLITRTLPTPIPQTISQAKTGLSSGSMRKIKSQASMRAISSVITKKRMQSKKSLAQGNHTSATDLESEEGLHYRSTVHEYEMRINTLRQIMGSPRYPRYLFEVRNMMVDVETLKIEEDQLTASKTSTGRATIRGGRGTIKGNISKKIKESQVKESKSSLKITRNESKSARDITWQYIEKDDTEDFKKMDCLSSTKLTIVQLLMEGANPKLVRCPQPALVLAIIAGNVEILNQLIRFGADVNERYPQLYSYTPLQVAVSRPFNTETIEIIRSLLENGAKANERLQATPTSTDMLSTEGPTLIHALIGRSTSSEAEEDLRKETMELLLQHGCDAYAFYENRSAMDYVMEQSLELLDVFISNETVVLNGSANAHNQSMLAKLLSADCFKNLPPTKRYQTLSNLLIFGADPLLPVRYEDLTYENILVYAKHELEDLKIIQQERKRGKKSELRMSTSKRRSVAMSSGSRMSRMTNLTVEADDVVDYTKCIDMVTEDARMLQIRWIQSKLVKELIELIVSKRPGTPWHIIMREHKNDKRTNIWLTAPRCLEIWEILRQAEHPIIRPSALKPLLAIVHYYNERETLSPKLVFKEKEAIDKYVDKLINEPKSEIPGRWPWRRRYATPELSSAKAKKFQICFECSLPLPWSKIECEFCNLVYFCSWECMSKNARGLCHPCSTSLIHKYFNEASVRGESDEFHIIHEGEE